MFVCFFSVIFSIQISFFFLPFFLTTFFLHPSSLIYNLCFLLLYYFDSFNLSILFAFPPTIFQIYVITLQILKIIEQLIHFILLLFPQSQSKLIITAIIISNMIYVYNSNILFFLISFLLFFLPSILSSYPIY